MTPKNWANRPCQLVRKKNIPIKLVEFILSTKLIGFINSTKLVGLLPGCRPEIKKNKKNKKYLCL
jgi:hypothetical protein